VGSPIQKDGRWADPLKAWGEVLVQQGITNEALKMPAAVRIRRDGRYSSP
jgi:hypothetical protein